MAEAIGSLVSDTRSNNDPLSRAWEAAVAPAWPDTAADGRARTSSRGERPRRPDGERSSRPLGEDGLREPALAVHRERHPGGREPGAASHGAASRGAASHGAESRGAASVSVTPAPVNWRPRSVLQRLSRPGPARGSSRASLQNAASHVLDSGQASPRRLPRSMRPRTTHVLLVIASGATRSGLPHGCSRARRLDCFTGLAVTRRKLALLVERADHEERRRDPRRPPSTGTRGHPVTPTPPRAGTPSPRTAAPASPSSAGIGRHAAPSSANAASLRASGSTSHSCGTPSAAWSSRLRPASESRVTGESTSPTRSGAVSKARIFGTRGIRSRRRPTGSGTGPGAAKVQVDRVEDPPAARAVGIDEDGNAQRAAQDRRRHGVRRGRPRLQAHLAVDQFGAHGRRCVQHVLPGRPAA